MNSKYALVLALVLGVVAAFAFQQHLQHLEEQARRQVQPVPVAFAREDIPEGAQMRLDVLEEKDWPQAHMFPDLVVWGDVESRLVGKVASQAIPKGTPILLSFVQVKQPPPPTAGIPTGRRGFTIATDAISAVSGMVKPGAYVDILGHLKELETAGPRRGPAGQAGTAITLLESVPVIGVGQYGGRGRGREGADLSSVTVAVYPLEAQVLAFVQREGSLSLALRREGDRDAVHPPAVDGRNLLQVIQQLRGAAGR